MHLNFDTLWYVQIGTLIVSVVFAGFGVVALVVVAAVVAVAGVAVVRRPASPILHVILRQQNL